METKEVVTLVISVFIGTFIGTAIGSYLGFRVGTLIYSKMKQKRDPISERGEALSEKLSKPQWNGQRPRQQYPNRGYNNRRPPQR